jgi:murein DD-endopeptidase MepM/ murein hydrolase activator NlpD
MIPGGKGEVKTWTVPIFFRPNSGANRNINSQCSTFQNGPGGTGTFIWPTTGTHTISGNDFWSGHLGLDISALLGDQVLATDSGWIVYAGSIAGGYGNMVMIDHGNGYYSLYGHLSQVLVTCGQYVNQGHVIGLAGSTGNSTGPHLHFELRYYDSFLNPWQYLQ